MLNQTNSFARLMESVFVFKASFFYKQHLIDEAIKFPLALFEYTKLVFFKHGASAKKGKPPVTCIEVKTWRIN